MHLRSGKIRRSARPCSHSQTQPKQTRPRFKGNARAKAVSPVIFLHGSGAIGHPAVIQKRVQKRIAVQQKAVFCHSHRIMGGKNELFIKTPQESIATNAKLFVLEDGLVGEGPTAAQFEFDRTVFAQRHISFRFTQQAVLKGTEL